MQSLARHPESPRRSAPGRSSVALAAFLAAGAAASVGHAQNLQLETGTETFTNLTNISGITGFTRTTGNCDDCTATINLPSNFNFTYDGQQVSSVVLSSNGWLSVSSQSSSFLSNTSIPSTNNPNGIIAAWWDDTVRTEFSYGVLGTAPNRVFIIEQQVFDFFSSSATFEYQYWLYESSLQFEVKYGTNAFGTRFTDASVGWEARDGGTTGSRAVLACTPSCSSTDASNLSGTFWRAAPPVDPELTGSFETFPRGALPGASAVGRFTFTNLGLNTATDVLTSFYLSADQTLDATDTLVGTATVTVANGTTTASVTVSVPTGFAAGDYDLIADVDSNDRFMENDETDNEVGGQRFATAYELQASNCRVTNPRGVNPGEVLNFETDVVNNGAPYAGALDVQLIASVDTTFDSSDTVLDTVSINLSGSNLETGAGSFTLGMGALTPGRYYPICRLDPNGNITELVSANNTVVGSDQFGSGPDFTISEVTMPAQVRPGNAVNIATTIANAAVPFTGSIQYRLYASTDDTLDTTQDVNLGLYTATFAGEDSITDTQSVTFGTNIPGGRYRIIAVADPRTQIAEVDEQNNTAVSATEIVNAIDFVGRQATVSPSRVTVRDTMTVTGQAESVGLSFVGNVAVGVYFSNDQTFDATDFEAYRGLIFFPGNTTASVNVTFPAPSVPPGTYNVLVVANPDNNPQEALLANNAARAPTTVTVLGADLRAETLTAPDIAFIGRQLEVNLEVLNESDEADANGFQYAYYLSENDLIRTTDRRVFVSQPVSIAAGSSQTYTDQIDIPASFTSTQSLYLGVIVDIFSDIPESSESNNVRRKPTPISIVFPIPDLEGQIVETATSAAAGEQLAVTRLIGNSGVADANDFTYTYYLSTNPTIEPTDIQLDSFQLSLPFNSDDYAIDTLSLPPGLNPATYFIGILLDPQGQLTEVTTENNAVVGPAITLFGAAITFTTDRLAPATVGVRYEEGLYARGGPLPITWSVSDGELPPGIELDATAGLLSGTPTTEGLYQFTLRASSGTAFAEREFEIRVTSPTVPLSIVTDTLRSAISGRPYTGANLVAVGGIPPYRWRVISGEVAGLTLNEDGSIEGTPATPGQFALTVRVEDDVGATATAQVLLNVVSPGNSIQIQRVSLPNGFVGQDYCAGGNVFSFQAVNSIGEVSWAATDGLPPGMELNAAGELCGVPEAAGVFDLTVRVQDSSGLFDTGLFRIEILGDDACGVATVNLPRGLENEPYVASDGGTVVLRASDACVEPLTWSIVDGAGDLPQAFTFNGNEGSITGTPGEDSAGAYAFVAQLTDASNNTSFQPLSIIIDAPEIVDVPEDEGCTCSVPNRSERSVAWLMVLPGLALVLARRRRR